MKRFFIIITLCLVCATCFTSCETLLQIQSFSYPVYEYQDVEIPEPTKIRKTVSEVVSCEQSHKVSVTSKIKDVHFRFASKDNIDLVVVLENGHIIDDFGSAYNTDHLLYWENYHTTISRKGFTNYSQTQRKKDVSDFLMGTDITYDSIYYTSENLTITKNVWVDTVLYRKESHRVKIEKPVVAIELLDVDEKLSNDPNYTAVQLILNNKKCRWFLIPTSTYKQMVPRRYISYELFQSGFTDCYACWAFGTPRVTFVLE